MVRGSNHALSRKTSVVASSTPLASPPITPASATGRDSSRDYERFVVELDDRAVQKREKFTFTSVPHPDSGVEPRAVERMHRLSELQHDVVGDVDDRGQRAQTASPQALRHPQRSSCPRVDAPDDAADVARATLRCVKRDGQDIVDSRLDDRLAFGRIHLDATCDRDLAGDSGDAQTVATIRSEAHLDDEIVEPEPFDQVHSDGRAGVKLDDSIPIVSETELPGGAEHALRDLAPNPALANLRAVRQPRPDPREGRAHPGIHVGGTANHAVQSGSAVVHFAQRQPVRAGMRLHADDFGDRHVPHRPADGGDRFDLEARRGEPLGELVRSDRRIGPLPEPAFVELHSRAPRR